MAFVLVPFGLVLLAVLAGAWRGRLRLERRADVLDLLAGGIRRGVPLPPLLAMVAGAEKPKRRRLLEGLSRALRGGSSLADALAGLGRGFLPAHALGAVRAAEGTDRLASAMEAVAGDAADALLWRQRFFLTLVYPLLILVGAVGVHAAILRYAGGDGAWWAPPSLAAGPGPALLFVGVAAALALGVAAARRTGLAPGAQTLATARCLGAAGLLAESGVPVARCLARAADASGSARLARRVRAAAASVEGGAPVERLWEPLALRAVDRLRLAAAGTRLPAVLREVASGCVGRWRLRMDAWFTWLQPATIVAASVLVFLEARHLFGWLESARGAVGGLW